MHFKLPNKYYFIKTLDTNLIKKQDKNTGIIYRDYTVKSYNKKLILKFNELCKKKNIKFFIANNIKLAKQLNLSGAYIPSFNKSMSHLCYNFQVNFTILGSAHNIKEMRIKEKQKVNTIFISSIFKKNRNFLGLNKFKLLSNLTRNRVVALGGVSIKNIKKLKLTKSIMFAGISFFE